MIYDLATEEQKGILESVYDVRPFFIEIITIEQIFVDKLFAAEAYVRKSFIRRKAFEAAKHIYDLAVMEKHPRIQILMTDVPQMKKLLAIRLEEENNRLDGIPDIAPKGFLFFQHAFEDANVKSAYETMQRQYVLRESDRIDYDKACASLCAIEKKLVNNNAWMESKPLHT